MQIDRARMQVAIVTEQLTSRIVDLEAELYRLRLDADQEIEALKKATSEAEKNISKREARIQELERLVNERYPDTPSDVEPE